MAKHNNQTSRERTKAEHLVYGNLLAATPGLLRLARETKTDLESGLGEVAARQRIRSRLEAEGMTLRKQLFPSVSRRVFRVSLRKLLHALADVLADKSESRRFGPALDSLLGKLGFDQWLEDYIYAYASEGRVLPILEGFAGAVKTVDLGPKDDATPTVWLVATPASDIEALIEELREAARAFPDETFTKNHGKRVEGAEYYRKSVSRERSYAQSAHDNISEAYPTLLASDDDAEFRLYDELVERETERIKKLAKRTAERGDRIIDYKSPINED